MIVLAVLIYGAMVGLHDPAWYHYVGAFLIDYTISNG